MGKLSRWSAPHAMNVLIHTYNSPIDNKTFSTIPLIILLGHALNLIIGRIQRNYFLACPSNPFKNSRGFNLLNSFTADETSLNFFSLRDALEPTAFSGRKRYSTNPSSCNLTPSWYNLALSLTIEGENGILLGFLVGTFDDDDTSSSVGGRNFFVDLSRTILFSTVFGAKYNAYFFLSSTKNNLNTPNSAGMPACFIHSDGLGRAACSNLLAIFSRFVMIYPSFCTWKISGSYLSRTLTPTWLSVCRECLDYVLVQHEYLL